MQRQKIKKRKRGERGIAKKTLIRTSELREIFAERKTVFLGLTKYETIAEVHKRKLSTILNYDNKQIDKLWNDIRLLKKFLRKKGIMAIIHKNMDRGFVLKDNIFGERKLERKTNIFFRCSTFDDAHDYRDKMDKIATSVFEAGTQVEKITSEGLKEKAILKVIEKQK